MRIAAVGVLAVMLAGCQPAAQAPLPTPTAAPSASATIAPTPTPATVLDINYLDQTGSHYTIWIDVTNHSQVTATGRPLIRLYWKEVSIGKLCGPALSVAPGATTRIEFQRTNGPAALFDHEDAALVPAC